MSGGEMISRGLVTVIGPSVTHPGCVLVSAVRNLRETMVHLTPYEAQGLAQRLLKEAAEVQFAASLNTAADGSES